MKKITMFIIRSCPFCQDAFRIMEALFKESPEYLALKIEKIDENIYPDIAKKYDYYYVPTFYVGDEKMHEGAASMKKVKRVFDAALEH